MNEKVIELKQALIVVIATAAQMGVDVDLLCQASEEALTDVGRDRWIQADCVDGSVAEIEVAKFFAVEAD